jgi:heterodisulfide reductase subunit C
MSKAAHLEPLAPRIADFHNAFMMAAERRGRFNEMEAMGIYESRTAIKELKSGNIGAIIDEMKSQAKLGMTMMKKKRMHFKIDKVKNKAELNALYRKSRAGKGV